MHARFYFSVVSIVSLCSQAPSQICAETRTASVGPYAQASIGVKTFLGKESDYAEIGPNFLLHLGIDVLPWFSLGGRIAIASHQATVPAPPVGEYLQLYQAAGEARLSVHTGPIALYTEGTLGITTMSTNVLAKVAVISPGQRSSPSVGAGGGIEYQTQNRHYALGLGGNWTLYPSYSSLQTAEIHAYLRYTY